MLTGLPKILESIGLNQVEFAKAIGVSEGTVSRWVNGRTPDGDKLIDVLSFIQKRNPQITLADLTAAKKRKSAAA